jgi:DNA-binding IclR family transcriptional regulator
MKRTPLVYRVRELLRRQQPSTWLSPETIAARVGAARPYVNRLLLDLEVLGEVERRRDTNMTLGNKEFGHRGKEAVWRIRSEISIAADE